MIVTGHRIDLHRLRRDGGINGSIIARWGFKEKDEGGRMKDEADFDSIHSTLVTNRFGDMVEQHEDPEKNPTTLAPRCRGPRLAG